MLLSIGMIVKNEEKYLDECLKSLNPILESIESELIIVDTGSTDNTIEIAKKYTNNLYTFEWCNDFSAARNKSLELAKGKYYMYLDADEILQDSSEIINLFKTNEHTKYNTYFYKVYNFITNNNLDDYNISHPARIFKMDSGTKFLGIIHEYIPYAHPIKILENTKFYHYGYINDSKILKDKKLYRNLSLLNNELQIEGNSPRLSILLYDSYISLGDVDNAIKFCDLGIEIAKTNNEFDYLYVLTVKKTYAYYFDNKFNKVIEEGLNYFKLIGNDEIATNIDMYYMMSISYYNLKDFYNTITCYNKYNELLSLYKSNLLNTSDLLLYSLGFISNDQQIFLDLHVVIAYFKQNNLQKAKLLFSNTNLNNATQTKEIVRLITICKLSFMRSKENYLEIINLYNRIGIDNHNYVNHSIEKFLNENPSQTEKLLESFYINYFKNFNTCNQYIQLMIIRYIDIYKKQRVNNLLNIVINMENKLTEELSDILYYVLKCNFPISKIANYINSDNVFEYLEIISKLHNDLFDIILNYDFIIENTKDIIITKEILRYELKIIKSIDNDVGLQIFDFYIDIVKKYFDIAYTKDYLTIDNINFISIQDRFDAYCYFASIVSQTNKVNCIKLLKSCLLEFPSMINIISIISDNIVQNNDVDKSEFNQLAVEVKNNIKLFINNKDLKSALELLKQYKEINPNDSDILILENQI
ncbi:glycosyltransferase family 2 protein [Sedimentibacter sp. zth1]|uniref:glycosyltransferase family 2 protein n=1 Tax=Sedimentibacter sp. zth1 TaxID=2816908 RepID=UPI001A921BA5|nr:glycosyltransferase family 2 protein [Sedimentibacter sp. zth1]QSX07162.1 glycosyltransferase family 2 protein [Sedimentibacter sp. zth1]